MSNRVSIPMRLLAASVLAIFAGIIAWGFFFVLGWICGIPFPFGEIPIRFAVVVAIIAFIAGIVAASNNSTS